MTECENCRGARIYDDQRCARCWARGVPLDLHHWAPQATFADANEWPQDYLCKRCHGEWHGRMVGDGYRQPANLKHATVEAFMAQLTPEQRARIYRGVG